MFANFGNDVAQIEDLMSRMERDAFTDLGLLDRYAAADSREIEKIMSVRCGHERMRYSNYRYLRDLYIQYLI